MKFALPLGQFVEEKNLGIVAATEVGFVITKDPDTVRAPDVAFIARERLASIAKISSYFPGAPDLAVEVISPNDAYAEVEDKVEAWLDAGCRMVVVANPRNRALKVYSSRTDISVLGLDDSFNGGGVLPGFHLPVRRIFPDQ